MANLKEVRTRISSIKSTQQITAAMKLVAASRLRKTQNAILKLRPYANKLQDILANLSDSAENSDLGAYTEIREPSKVLIVAFSSNRGLCGAFNTNVIRKVRLLIENEYAVQYAAGNVQLMTIGRKVSEHYQKRNYAIAARFDDIYEDLSFARVATIAEQLMKEFAARKYDRIVLVYNQFKNAAVQQLVTEQYLPVEKVVNDEGSHNVATDFIFEPDQETILRELIPKILKIQLYKASLDSFASEHGARMTAMHQATDNAKEILRELNLSYNKARQAAITTEILEIVSGANALQEGA